MSRHLRKLSSLASLTPRHQTPDCRSLLDWARVVSTRAQLQEVLDQFYAPASPLDDKALAALFHACARHKCLEQGRALHRYMLLNQNGPPDLFVSNHLVNMYAKCGDLECARKVFDEMPRRNYVSWTALVSGYAQHGRGDECFSLFSGMLAHHRPNEFAFASVLSSCRERDGDRGRQGLSSVALEDWLSICLPKCILEDMGLIVLHFLESFLPCLEAAMLVLDLLLIVVFSYTVSQLKLVLPRKWK